MGLLLPHKSTRVTIYADMVTFSTPHENASKTGKRGDVEVMSKGSRMRLLKLMHQLEYTSITMVTLTYPADFPTDGRKVKRQLKEYRRRFERKWGTLRALWRLELQKRGAPHFHVIYFDCGFIPVGEVSEMWHDVIKSVDENHLKNGVDLKRVHEGSDRALVMHYVSKYVAKVQKEVEDGRITKVGRWWGRWNIEEPTPITVDLAHGSAGIVANRLLDTRGRDLPWQPDNVDSFSLFGCRMGSCEYREFVLSVIGALRKP